MKHFIRKLPLRRLTALLLGILLVPALLPVQASFADEPGGGETETPAKPDMRVIATLVGEQQYLEVGLNIDSKEGGTFQSAAALLTYDPTILTPVVWDGMAQEVTVPTVEESALAWDQTKLIPTKGADEMSGKLSSAVGVQGKDRGYLFLSAETAMPMLLRQGQPVGDTPADAPTATANSHPVTCIAKTETATEQAVVVRFRVNEKPPQGGGEPGTRELQGYTLAELVSSLDLVSAGDGAISSFPLSGSAGTSYLADNSSIETTGFETETNLSFVWILDGVSVNTAGTAPSETGSGLDINLAGGRWRDSDAVAAKDFEDKAAALKKGETLTLPEIEPGREGGYTFAGWTLGERDSDGRLILYRHGAAVTPPGETEMVTVTWKNGETDGVIDHTFTSAPKGYTVTAKDCPEPPADIDKDAEGENPAVHKTFDKWEQSVDEATGNITMTAVFKDKSPVTYVWVDPLQEGEDKTVPNEGWTNPSYNPPTAEQHPAAPNHGEDHPFKEWVMGEPVEVDGVITVTFTATYKTLITYKWVDAEGAPIMVDEAPVTKTSYDPPTESEYPAPPVVEGKDFKGWDIGQPVSEEDGTVTVTITATYGQKTTYIWVDDLTGATLQTIADQFEKPEDPEPLSHEGWTFQGWSVGEPVTGEDGTVTVTITATYEMEKWTVRDTLPAIQTLPASLAAVWSGGTGSSGGGGLAVNLAGGHWQTEDEGAGQSFAADCAALQPGDSITIPDITPVRENYSFAGWTLGGHNEAGETALLFANEKVTLGDEASSLAAVWNSTPDGFVTIVCYDWDETLLGSVTVPKGASEEEVMPYLNRFVQSLQSPESHDRDTSKEAFFVDDKDYPLTYKRGYSFACWLPNDSDLPTHCGRNYNGDNSPITIPNPAEEGTAQSFANLQENITIKACYQDNSELYYTEDPTQLTYTLKAEKYSRIGATTTYIITYRFLRQTTIEEDGVQKVVGVPRLAEPQLRLIYNGNLYNFFGLETGDNVTFTAYPDGNTITSTDAVMVDFYQASVLTNASNKTGVQSDTNGTSPTDHNGFRHKGTLGMINEELAANSTKNLTAVVLRVQAGLTYTNLAEARTNLRTAWVKLNSTDGTEATIKPKAEWVDLTFDQMNYAIANNGDLLL